MAAPALHTAKTRPELDAVADCLWDAFTSPPEVTWSLYERGDPAFRQGNTDSFSQQPLDAIAASKDRLWDAHNKNPYDTWIYIADETQQGDVISPRVLAACMWRVYKTPTNPYENGVPEIKSGAWPEGSVGGALAARFVRALMTPRVMWMARPHVGLSLMAVWPDARQRGLGSIMMQWGIKQADELGLETYIDGTELGKHLYARHGLKVIRKFQVDLTVPEGVERKEWEALTRFYFPTAVHFNAMWRPALGEWGEEGDKTWQSRFELWDAKKEATGDYIVVPA